MTPFSQFKGWTAEGGIRNALILSGPAVKRPAGSINHGSCTSRTSCRRSSKWAGTSYPKSMGGKELHPLIGKSWGRCSQAR